MGFRLGGHPRKQTDRIAKNLVINIILDDDGVVVQECLDENTSHDLVRKSKNKNLKLAVVEQCQALAKLGIPNEAT